MMAPRRRERASGMGLLPRMEARPHKDGVTVSYRYHPFGAKPIPLGTDRAAAIREVARMLGQAHDSGTVAELWALYQRTPAWARLAETTRAAYTEQSAPLLRVFGAASPAEIRPQHVARYLRQERAGAPVSANREVALLSNLMNLSVERGDIDRNPCREVRRNPEAPRTEAVAPEALAAFVAWAATQRSEAARRIARMAEFAALVGSRRGEFLGLCWTQVQATTIRLRRSKQRGGREVWDEVEITPRVAELLAVQRATAIDGRVGPVFPSNRGDAYRSRGFATMWQRVMAAALGAGVITRRFTFHDLRAYYATQHKAQRGSLPDLHRNPATTARVYDRTSVAKRRAL